jgi:hypothetical protein
LRAVQRLGKITVAELRVNMDSLVDSVPKTTKIDRPIHIHPEDGNCNICRDVGHSQYLTQLAPDYRRFTSVTDIIYYRFSSHFDFSLFNLRFNC